jgi:hypothetical protein
MTFNEICKILSFEKKKKKKKTILKKTGHLPFFCPKITSPFEPCIEKRCFVFLNFGQISESGTNGLPKM